MKTSSILSMAPTLLCAAAFGTASAEKLNSAKITQAIKDVKVYKDKAVGRSATIGETITGSTSVTTGRRSRAELTFQDETITRIGQNSIFSFRQGSREVELKKGTLMLQVPKDGGGATIRTATVTAAITGTTSLMEYNPGHWVKLITLEGTQKIYLNGSKKPVSVPAGKMIIMQPNATSVPMPVSVDVSRLMATSALADKRNFRALPPEANEAIAETVDRQAMVGGKTAASPAPRPANKSSSASERGRKAINSRVKSSVNTSAVSRTLGINMRRNKPPTKPGYDY